MATTAEKVMAGGGDNSVFVVINLMLTSLFIKRSNKPIGAEPLLRHLFFGKGGILVWFNAPRATDFREKRNPPQAYYDKECK